MSSCEKTAGSGKVQMENGQNVAPVWRFASDNCVCGRETFRQWCTFVKTDPAYKIDNLWKEIIVNHYSKLSDDFKLEIAENSGHYIHLTDKEKLYNTIDKTIPAHSTRYSQ